MPFTYGTFEQVLVRALAQLLQQGLELLENRNLRLNALVATSPESRLTQRELAVMRDLALDETEDKSRRKRAIEAVVARNGFDLDDTIDLLQSQEQGIQRLAMSELGRIYQERPAVDEIFDRATEIANSTDDVAITRRAIAALMDLDLGRGIEALSALNMMEEGLRRRARGISVRRARLALPRPDPFSPYR